MCVCVCARARVRACTCACVRMWPDPNSIPNPNPNLRCDSSSLHTRSSFCSAAMEFGLAILRYAPARTTTFSRKSGLRTCACMHVCVRASTYTSGAACSHAYLQHVYTCTPGKCMCLHPCTPLGWYDLVLGPGALLDLGEVRTCAD